MTKEITKAKDDLHSANIKLKETLSDLKSNTRSELLPAMLKHAEAYVMKCREKVRETHNQKLLKLSIDQDKPLFTVKNTVILYDVEETPPTYVMETLLLGPKKCCSYKV